MDQHAAFRRHIKELEDRVQVLETQLLESAKYTRETREQLYFAGERLASIAFTSKQLANNTYEWKP